MKFVVISPHPDDELIGCFSLFKRGLVERVIYINFDKKRVAEAQITSKNLGFLTEFVRFDEFYEKKLILEPGQVCLVPDILDSHPLHKSVNVIAKTKGCSLGYYTTDMNTGYTRELVKELQKEKREILNKFYPTQKSLWENNWKYFLFEGITYDLLSSSTPS